MRCRQNPYAKKRKDSVNDGLNNVQAQNNTNMKRLLLVIITTLAISTAAMSQHHIGLRLSEGYGAAVEVSYQRLLNGDNRIELDLGYNTQRIWHSVNLTGIYQWRWELIDGLGWFMGGGANVSFLDYGDFGLGIDGQIGLDYYFHFPMQISLDMRPAWHLLGTSDYKGFAWGGVNLAIRYRF